MQYAELLNDELADAQKRYALADKEGRAELNRQIKEIERDIQRNTATK